MMLARGLFDNVAETPDELTFSRGDVLTVYEKDYGGLEGWWLCAGPDGKTGIAPANRLKIIRDSGNLQPIFVKSAAASNALDYDIPQQSYDITSPDLTINKSAASGSDRGGSLPRAGFGAAVAEDYDVPTIRRPSKKSEKEMLSGKPQTAGGSDGTSSSSSSSSPWKPDSIPFKSVYRELPRPPKKETKSMQQQQQRQQHASTFNRVAASVGPGGSGGSLEDYDVPLSRVVDVQPTWQQCLDTARDMATTVTQLIANAERWRSCKDALSLVSIIKTVSISLRNKLTNLICLIDTACVPSTGASLTRNDRQLVVQRLQSCADELVVVVEERSSSSRAASGDQLWLIENIIRISRRIREYLEELLPQYDASMAANPNLETMPPLLPHMSAVSRKNVAESNNQERKIASAAAVGPSEDYDVPTAELNNNTATTRRSAGKQTDSASNAKRVAVVVDNVDADDQVRSFDVLERRNAKDDRLTRSKLIVADSNVDYDYPVVCSQHTHVLLQLANRQLFLLGRASEVLAELTADDATRAAHVKAAVLAVYGLVFVGDAALRAKCLPADTSLPIQQRCDSLVQSARSMATDDARHCQLHVRSAMSAAEQLLGLLTR